MTNLIERSFPMVAANATARAILARAREGRVKALASIGRSVVVSCISDDALHRHSFRYKPTVQDLLETLGSEAVVIGVELHRDPSRKRPLLLV